HEILKDLRDEKLEVARPELVRRACERLTQYLIHRAVQEEAGPRRVRIAIMTALIRANLFRYTAETGKRDIIKALKRALTRCLRDEERIVRVESLRAVAVALRNIGVLLVEAGDKYREDLRDSFFPRGLKTIQWLVSTIL